jgi:hypothetical protein
MPTIFDPRNAPARSPVTLAACEKSWQNGSKTAFCGYSILRAVAIDRPAWQALAGISEAPSAKKRYGTRHFWTSGHARLYRNGNRRGLTRRPCQSEGLHGGHIGHDPRTDTAASILRCNVGYGRSNIGSRHGTRWMVVVEASLVDMFSGSFIGWVMPYVVDQRVVGALRMKMRYFGR